jgi:dolichol-phosphate mannosyltransferase
MITPVLNEAPNMEDLVSGWRQLCSELSEFNFKFLLIDDGSTDGTAAVARNLSTGLDLTVITHQKNMGPGYAFGSGFENLYSKLNPEDIVVTIEGDNTSRLDTLKIMLGRIVGENVEVALASVHAYGGGIQNTNSFKVFLSHMSSAMTKLSLNIRGIHTFTSFFRAYKGHVILKLQQKYGPRIIEFRGFECMIELLKKITIFRFTITEVPMNLDTSLRKGKSKLKIIRTSFKYFAVFLQARKWDFKQNEIPVNGKEKQ